MRFVWTVMLLGAALACGCGAEKQRPTVGDTDVTAAHLRGLQPDDSVLRHLAPTEEEARALAEEDPSRADGPPDPTGGFAGSELEEEPSTQEKWEQASIAVLQVAVTVGAMVAPFFLF